MKIDFQKATKCHICDQQYTDKDIRVKDHCHITGEFRGSAHQDCNLKLRIKPATIKFLSYSTIFVGMTLIS